MKRIILVVHTLCAVCAYSSSSVYANSERRVVAARKDHVPVESRAKTWSERFGWKSLATGGLLALAQLTGSGVAALPAVQPAQRLDSVPQLLYNRDRRQGGMGTSSSSAMTSSSAPLTSNGAASSGQTSASSIQLTTVGFGSSGPVVTSTAFVPTTMPPPGELHCDPVELSLTEVYNSFRDRDEVDRATGTVHCIDGDSGQHITCAFRSTDGSRHYGDPQIDESQCHGSGARILDNGEVDVTYRSRYNPSIGDSEWVAVDASIRDFKIRTSDGKVHGRNSDISCDVHYSRFGDPTIASCQGATLVEGQSNKVCLDAHRSYFNTKFIVNGTVTKGRYSLEDIYAHAVEHGDDLTIKVEADDGRYKDLVSFSSVFEAGQGVESVPDAIRMVTVKTKGRFQISTSLGHTHLVRLAGTDKSVEQEEFTLSLDRIVARMVHGEKFQLKTHKGWRTIESVTEGVTRSLINPIVEGNRVKVYGPDGRDYIVASTQKGNLPALFNDLNHEFYRLVGLGSLNRGLRVKTWMEQGFDLLGRVLWIVPSASGYQRLADIVPGESQIKFD